MDLLPVILILISALLHCSWNLICKSSRPSSGFFLLISLVSLIFLLPFCLSGLDSQLFKESRLLLFFIPSGLAQTLYYVSLANAYRSTQISLAYPLARSLPVIFVPAVNFFISGERVSLAAMGGMLLIAAGCLLFPVVKRGESIFTSFKSSSFIWILLAAMGTTAYTILDSRGLIYLSNSSSLSRSYLAVFYMTGQTLFIIINLVIFNFLNKKELTRFKQTILLSKKQAILAGLFLTLAYLFVLRAMSEGVNVGYLSALRQASIPLGASLGIILLHEDRNLKKITAIILVTAGLVITALN